MFDILQTNAETVAHAVQLAVVPVFLLTGIGAVMNVLSGRLVRAIDRVRSAASHAADGVVTPDDPEPSILAARISLIHWAIRLNVGAALLICLMVAGLFVSDFSPIDPAPFVAGLFIVAMILLIVSFSLFLREITLATRQTQLEIDHLVDLRRKRADP